MAKVIAISDNIQFDDGSILSSIHHKDCCEDHYLSFDDLEVKDFEGLEFDLDSDNFFKEVYGYGIKLVPIKGYPINIPGYGYNDGYYSSNLILVLKRPTGTTEFDISDCQEIKG